MSHVNLISLASHTQPSCASLVDLRLVVSFHFLLSFILFCHPVMLNFPSFSTIFLQTQDLLYTFLTLSFVFYLLLQSSYAQLSVFSTSFLHYYHGRPILLLPILLIRMILEILYFFIIITGPIHRIVSTKCYNFCDFFITNSLQLIFRQKYVFLRLLNFQTPLLLLAYCPCFTPKQNYYFTNAYLQILRYNFVLSIV